MPKGAHMSNTLETRLSALLITAFNEYRGVHCSQLGIKKVSIGQSLLNLLTINMRSFHNLSHEDSRTVG